MRVGEEDDAHHPQPVGHVGAHHGVVDVADHPEVRVRERHQHPQRRTGLPSVAGVRAGHLHLNFVPDPIDRERLPKGNLNVEVPLVVGFPLPRPVLERHLHPDAGDGNVQDAARRVQQVRGAAGVGVRLPYAPVPHHPS